MVYCGCFSFQQCVQFLHDIFHVYWSVQVPFSCYIPGDARRFAQYGTSRWVGYYQGPNDLVTELIYPLAPRHQNVRSLLKKHECNIRKGTRSVIFFSVIMNRLHEISQEMYIFVV